MNARLGTGWSIMIEGRRARSFHGSPHSDRPIRRGASVTGVCQCASRAFSLWCRASTACTDGSSPGHWLGRSSYPGLGSRRNNHAVRDSCSTSARVRGPPRVRVHRRRFKNGLTNKSSWKRTLMRVRSTVLGFRSTQLREVAARSHQPPGLRQLAKPAKPAGDVEPSSRSTWKQLSGEFPPPPASCPTLHAPCPSKTASPPGGRDSQVDRRASRSTSDSSSSRSKGFLIG